MKGYLLLFVVVLSLLLGWGLRQHARVSRRSVADCPDMGGQHVPYDPTTPVFSCARDLPGVRE